MTYSPPTEPVDPAALRIFCELVEAGSFTRAAERLFITQSAVSQRLRALERRYGRTLIERAKGRGRLEPTEAGRLLYEGARQLLRDAEELDARLRGLQDDLSGTVRVATVYSVGLHALPGRLKPFLAAHPRINVRLEYSQTAKIYRDVLSGGVDVGIVACPSPRSGIEILPFGEEEMALICAPEHPFASRDRIALAELQGEPFIAFSEQIPTRKLIDERLLLAGTNVNVVMEFDNIETIKNLVEIGSGVALVPEQTVRQETREGALRAIRLADPDRFQRPEGLLVRSRRTHRAAVRAFLEAMRAG